MCGQTRLAAGASCQVCFQSLNSHLVTFFSTCPVACNPRPTQTQPQPLHSAACLSTWTVSLLSPSPWSDSPDTIQRCQVQAACKLTTVFNSTVLSGLDSLHPTLSWPLFCSQSVPLGALCSTSEDAADGSLSVNPSCSLLDSVTLL